MTSSQKLRNLIVINCRTQPRGFWKACSLVHIMIDWLVFYGTSTQDKSICATTRTDTKLKKVKYGYSQTPVILSPRINSKVMVVHSKQLEGTAQYNISQRIRDEHVNLITILQLS